jgi:hypothetical protein
LRVAMSGEPDKRVFLKSETSGLTERALCAAIHTDSENRAQFLHDAVKGAGTDEDAMVDCLCTATPSQISATREYYNKHNIIKFEARVLFLSCLSFQTTVVSHSHDRSRMRCQEICKRSLRQ